MYTTVSFGRKNNTLWLPLKCSAFFGRKSDSGNLNYRGSNACGWTNKHAHVHTYIISCHGEKSSRCEQGSNLRGQSPMDFKSISLTTRTSQLCVGTHYLCCYRKYISYNQQMTEIVTMILYCSITAGQWSLLTYEWSTNRYFTYLIKFAVSNM